MINIYKMIHTCLIVSILMDIGCTPGSKNSDLLTRAEIPYLAGESRMIISANPDPENDPRKWYTNDHCFIVDHNGTFHWFGINNPFPEERKLLYKKHSFIGHLVSADPAEKWQRLPHAMDTTIGSENLGAPYVIWHEETSKWVMVVAFDTGGDRKIEVCWSDDLNTWERTNQPILPNKLASFTRDPHIIKGDDEKYWITLISSEKIAGNIFSQVIRIKTSDFQEFEDPDVLYSIKDGIIWSGIESPILIERNGLWYLFFTYAHRRYAETLVLVSENPNKFERENTITTLFAHAPEIFTYDSKTYITSCGPEDDHILNDHGVSMTELKWMEK